MRKWVEVVGWTLTAVFVYFVIEVFITIMFQKMASGNMYQEEYARNVLVANVAMKGITFIFFGIWYKLREDKGNFRPDYKGVFSVKNIMALLGIGIFGQYAVTTMVTFFRILVPDVFVEYDKGMKLLSMAQNMPYLAFFLVVILGPIAEEILFRGVIYGKLRDVFSITQAAVISGAIFGIYHKNIVQGLYAALFGILLAVIFEKTQTIWGSIFIHIMFNMSAFCLNLLQKIVKIYSISFPSILYMVLEGISVIVVAVCFFVLRKRENRYDLVNKCRN